MKRAELDQLLKEVNEVRCRFGHLELYRLQTDWGSSGIWLPKVIGSISTGPNLILDNFPLSDRVRQRLSAWNEMFEEEYPERIWENPGTHAWFSAEGINVAIDISLELGDGAVVEYKLGNHGLLFLAGRCVAIYPMDPSTSGLWKGTDD